jgi:hypothetical protein
MRRGLTGNDMSQQSEKIVTIGQLGNAALSNALHKSPKGFLSDILLVGGLQSHTAQSSARCLAEPGPATAVQRRQREFPSGVHIAEQKANRSGLHHSRILENDRHFEIWATTPVYNLL